MLLLLYVEILDTVLSAVGQEHEVLLRDKLMERNLSFLGESVFQLLITFLTLVLQFLSLGKHCNVVYGITYIKMFMIFTQLVVMLGGW